MLEFAVVIGAFLLALIISFKLTYGLSGRKDARAIEQHEIAVEGLVQAAVQAIPHIGRAGGNTGLEGSEYTNAIMSELKQAIFEVTHEHWSASYRD